MYDIYVAIQRGIRLRKKNYVEMLELLFLGVNITISGWGKNGYDQENRSIHYLYCR